MRVLKRAGRGVLFALAVVAGVAGRDAPVAAAEAITVFAAASTTDAVTRTVADYEAETGVDVRLSFAASSTLARQIEAGAEAQIYISANVRWMDYLEERGLLADGSRRAPVSNRLVLIAGADRGIGGRDDAASYLAALGSDEWLALGDPAHVPAGIYARQALRSLKLWDRLAPRMALSDNVRSALALVDRGEAALGIVYRTDAMLAGRIAELAVFPAASHDPIVYPFAIVAGQDTAPVRHLFDHLTGPKGIAVFESFGFVKN